MTCNDQHLNEILIDLAKEQRIVSDLLRDGKVDSAFLVAHVMRRQLDAFMDRCNELRWPPKK